MILGFDIQYLRFKNEMGKRWWNSTDILEKVIRIYDKYFSLDEYKYFESTNTDKVKEANSLEDKIIEARKLNKDRDLFWLRKHEEDNDYIQLRVTTENIGISFFYEEHIYENINIIEPFGKLVTGLYDEFKDVFLFGPSVGIFLIDYDYPRLRPIRDFKFLGSTALINVISKEHFEKNRQLCIEGMENLYYGELPSGVTRKVHDNDLYIIKWFDKIENEADIEKALIRREDWIYQNCKLNLFYNFTLDGDKLFETSLEPCEEDPFFTFYNSGYKIGFKAVTLNQNNYIAPEIEEAIKMYNAKKTIANGEPLDKIILVLPGRKYVMEINEKVKRIGIDKVLYIDDKGRLWDPFPPGNWRN